MMTEDGTIPAPDMSTVVPLIDIAASGANGRLDVVHAHNAQLVVASRIVVAHMDA